MDSGNVAAVRDGTNGSANDMAHVESIRRKLYGGCGAVFRGVLMSTARQGMRHARWLAYDLQDAVLGPHESFLGSE